ncbi:MAG: RsiV family protein [Clostridiales bacterium]|nr:RsiV family protein [Clostridiales bacterium]
MFFYNIETPAAVYENHGIEAAYNAYEKYGMAIPKEYENRGIEASKIRAETHENYGIEACGMPAKQTAETCGKTDIEKTKNAHENRGIEASKTRAKTHENYGMEASKTHKKTDIEKTKNAHENRGTEASKIRAETHENYGIEACGMPAKQTAETCGKTLSNAAYGADSAPSDRIEKNISYTVTYDKNDVLSFYRDEYVYREGDAHGLTTRASKTVDLKNCKTLMLGDFFKTPKERAGIITEIIRQARQNAAKNPAFYFDGYENLIKEKFDPKNFYLSGENAVTIYYPPYDIAPYSSGIPEFSIPYTAVNRYK